VTENGVEGVAKEDDECDAEPVRRRKESQVALKAAKPE